MALPPFEYEYKPIHPFLHGRKPQFTLKYILTISCCIFTLPLIFIKYILGIIFMGLLEMSLNILTLSIKDEQPLLGWREQAFKVICRVCWTGYLLSQGIIIKTSGTRDPSASILVSNHRSLTDILVHTVLHTPCFLHREDLSQAFGIGAMFRASRSIQVSKTSTNKKATEKMQQALKDGRQVCVFIEGTTSFDGVVLRPRPGAFKTGFSVQPVALHYYSLFGQAWLCESLLMNLFLTSLSPLTLCKVEYLPVNKNETPDQCGKRLSDALGVEFVPYSNADYWYFGGKAVDTSNCTKEYLSDFGWMGRHENYVKMCQKVGKNHFYQWDAFQLNIDSCS